MAGTNSPCLQRRAVATAWGTYVNGKPVHGKWHIYPEMAAAGLWTTPTDLAHFAIEIALSKNGKSNRILSQKMTNEILTPVLDTAALGFFLEKDNPGAFGHDGADEGFQALLTMNYDSGKGVVIMADSDNGIAVAGQLLRSVAREYDWNYKIGEDATLDLYLDRSRERPQSAALERFDQIKTAHSPDHAMDEGLLNTLGYQLLSEGKSSDAIAVFQRNVQDHPQSSNAYDSLGEAYMKAGQKEFGHSKLREVLAARPQNTNAVDMLKKLKEPKYAT